MGARAMGEQRPMKDDDKGWLPDEEYSVSQAMIMSIILLALTVLVGAAA